LPPAPAGGRRPRLRDHAGSGLRREAAARVPRPAARGRKRSGRDRRAHAAARRRDERPHRTRERPRARERRAPAHGACLPPAPRPRRPRDRRVTRDLTPLFEPRSVAIVGVSADPEKWGHWFARDALRGAHRRDVYFVGRSGGELLGRPVHRSLAELPEAPELVVLSVPAAGLEAAVDDSLAVGARAIVAIAAGMGELSAEGQALQRAIVDRVRGAGAVLLGPNCLGVFDSAAELELAWNQLSPGPVGFISQSGNVALEVGLLLQDYGLGYSRLASIGNQADLDATELVA